MDSLIGNLSERRNIDAHQQRVSEPFVAESGRGYTGAFISLVGEHDSFRVGTSTFVPTGQDVSDVAPPTDSCRDLVLVFEPSTGAVDDLIDSAEQIVEDFAIGNKWR